MLPYLLNTFTNVFCRTVLRYVHGRMGMDVWVKASCLVSWAIFFSLSSWRCVHGCMGLDMWVNVLGAAEARQERVIVEIVRKAIVAGQFFCISWTHLQIFSVSTVLGEKTSDADQYWRVSAKLSGGRLLPTLDRKRTTTRRRHVWGVECFAQGYVAVFVQNLHKCFLLELS